MATATTKQTAKQLLNQKLAELLNEREAASADERYWIDLEIEALEIKIEKLK